MNLKNNIAIAVLAVALIATIAIALLVSARSRASTVADTPRIYYARNAVPGLPSGSQGIGVPLVDVQQGLSAVVARIRPAVVSIAAHRAINTVPPYPGVQLLDPFPVQNNAVGSGVIVDPAGLILTSRQVTGETESVQVKLFRSSRESLIARRVVADPITNLALYRLRVAGQLPFATLGDSIQVRTGNIVIAIGSPFGLSETVTQGIVSTSRRSVIAEGRRYDDLIQTDAAINQGNCGGPLVNIQAEVVGINLAIYSTDTTFAGIGFAIPSNQALPLLQRAIEINQ